MIFADPLNKAVAGSSLGAAPGALSRLQKTLQAVAILFNDANYNPGRTDGVADFNTAWALASVAHDASVRIPGPLGDLLGTITGLATRDRSYAMLAYSAAPAEINGFVGDVADAVDQVLSEAFSRLRGLPGNQQTLEALRAIITGAPLPPMPGVPTAPTIPPRQIIRVFTPRVDQYPAGTVAVRDPAVGKFRLLITA